MISTDRQYYAQYVAVAFFDYSKNHLQHEITDQSKRVLSSSNHG